MKLILITSEYPNMLGGVSDYTYHLSNALVNEKMEVFVITSDDIRVRNNNNGKDKVTILPIIKRWNIFCIPKIIKVIKNIKPNVINIHYVPYMYNCFGLPMWMIIFAFCLCLLRCKVITTFHEIAMDFNFNPKHCILTIFQRMIAFSLATVSEKIIINIEYWKNMLYLFRDKISVVYVGSNILPCLFVSDEKAKLRKEIAPNNELIISTFSNLELYRKDDIFLEAIKKISESQKKVSIKVLFIGKASVLKQERLEEKINKYAMEKAVQFLGYMEPNDIYKHLSVSDIFIMLNCMPNGGIGLRSTSLAAAYAAGLPIVGVKGNATDSFFKNEENVFFAKSLNVEDVKSAIWMLIEDIELRTKLAKGAYDSYKNYLEWNVIAKQYLNILSCCINS